MLEVRCANVHTLIPLSISMVITLSTFNLQTGMSYVCTYISVSMYMYIYKCKNISIKMLKDAVPKSRKTRAVYMQQHRG